MSSYDPTRFLSPQQQNQGPSNEYFHIPKYAAPDLDPTGPLPEDNAQDERYRMSENGYEDAGPSRKRSRASGEENGHHGNGHHGQQVSAPSSSKRPVPASIFGFDARNDLLREIADWLLHTCQGRENIEIEIKLGTIVHRGRPNDPPVRLQLPGVLSEKTVYGTSHAFSSDMTHKQHASLNKILNGLVENPPDPSNRLHYKRIKQKDSFYMVNGRKVRVSSLAETGQVTETIQKEKVDHLDIFCPASPLDLRISVNTETPCEHPEGEPSLSRTKDRISYSHSVCQVDLTWVSIPVAEGKPKSTFEVEVEVVDVETLLRDSHTAPELFDLKLQCCMDTARILMRNASG